MNALLASLLLAAASAAGTKPEQIRALAALPTVNLENRFEFHSSDFQAFTPTNTSKRTEVELRDLVKAEPTNAVAWCDLGGTLSARALRDCLHIESISLEEELPKLLQALCEGRITADGVRKATRLINESLDCYNKSIQLNPQYSYAYIQRASHRMADQTCVQVLLNTLDKKPSNALSLVLAPENLADLQQACRLCPSNVGLQTTFAVYLMMSDARAKNANGDPTTGLGTAVSETSRAAIRESHSCLESLTKLASAKSAAAAYEGLGIIDFILDGASSDAEKHFRHAVRLDPTSDLAWDWLVGMCLDMKRNDDILAVCAERVKATDTVRNRYLLAKAHWRLDHLDKADEQLRLILKRDPKNFLASAGMAAVMLRRDDSATADEFLHRAEILATNDIPAEQRADLYSLFAIRALLAHDHDTAELYLKQAFKLDPDNKNAKAVHGALKP